MSDCKDCIEDGITNADAPKYETLMPGRAPEGITTEYLPGEQIDLGRRNVGRRLAIAGGFAALVALITGRTSTKAAWTVGYCTRYVCTSQCRVSEQKAWRYRNEFGQEWCGTTWWNTGVYWQQNCCQQFGRPINCC